MTEATLTITLEVGVKYPESPAEAFIREKKRDAHVWLGEIDITDNFTKDEIGNVVDSLHKGTTEIEVEVMASGVYDPGEPPNQDEGDPGYPSGWDDLTVFWKDIDITSEVTEKQMSLVMVALYNK